MMLRLAALPIALVATYARSGWAVGPTVAPESKRSTANPISSASPPPSYRFFSPDDVCFIEAAVERMIPADEHGPGARHAGAAVFIDRCLQGGWNSTDRLYRNRFWQAGRKIDDYRLPATPGTLFRSALHGIEDDLASRPGLLSHVAARHSARRRFANLPVSDQDAYLRGLQMDIRLLGGVPSWLFLEFLFTLTVEAFFGDPAVTGNEDTFARSESEPATFEPNCIPIHRCRSRRTT